MTRPNTPDERLLVDEAAIGRAGEAFRRALPAQDDYRISLIHYTAFNRAIRAALNSLSLAPAAGDGWVLVPRVPTDAMCAGGVRDAVLWKAMEDAKDPEDFLERVVIMLQKPRAETVEGEQGSGGEAVAWTVFDSKHLRFTLYNRELAEAIAERGLMVLPMFGRYEWFATSVGKWTPIDRLPHTWERELGIQWRERTAAEQPAKGEGDAFSATVADFDQAALEAPQPSDSADADIHREGCPLTGRDYLISSCTCHRESRKATAEYFAKPSPAQRPEGDALERRIAAEHKARESICACIGCTNQATHTWSGHPTCDACGTPGRVKLDVPRITAFDSTPPSAEPQAGVVDDAMAERAWRAGREKYSTLVKLSHEWDEPNADDIASMKAALTAALTNAPGAAKGGG